MANRVKSLTGRSFFALCFVWGLWSLALSPLKIYPEENIDWLRSRMGHLNEKGSSFNTLIVGPSYLMAGFHPAVFNTVASDEGLSLNSFKLAAASLSLPEADYLLRQLSGETLSKIKLVILDVSFSAWETWPANSFVFRSLYWSDWQSLLLSAKLTDWTKWKAPNGLHTLLLRLQHTLVWTFKIGAARELLSQTLYPQKRQSLAKLDYTPRPQLVPLPESVFAEKVKETNQRWSTPQHSFGECRQGLDRPQEAVLNYMEELASRLQRKNIKVLFVVSPVPSPWLCRLDDEVNSRLPLIQFNRPNAFPSLYQPKMRRDVNHLNREGARVFSTELAKAAVRLLRETATVAGE